MRSHHTGESHEGNHGGGGNEKKTGHHRNPDLQNKTTRFQTPPTDTQAQTVWPAAASFSACLSSVAVSSLPGFDLATETPAPSHGASRRRET